mmetsp:Transcript_31222/g.89493  ORF Transcript_31222/g.89493 Transcript_31222/m.89493 type:complete len:204 (+) Transcript_31222:408-1019(+)
MLLRSDTQGVMLRCLVSDGEGQLRELCGVRARGEGGLQRFDAGLDRQHLLFERLDVPLQLASTQFNLVMDLLVDPRTDEVSVGPCSFGLDLLLEGHHALRDAVAVCFNLALGLGNGLVEVLKLRHHGLPSLLSLALATLVVCGEAAQPVGHGLHGGCRAFCLDLLHQILNVVVLAPDLLPQAGRALVQLVHPAVQGLNLVLLV